MKVVLFIFFVEYEMETVYGLILVYVGLSPADGIAVAFGREDIVEEK